MDIKRTFQILALFACASVSTCTAQTFSLRSDLSEINQWNEPYRIAWLNWYVDSGMTGTTSTLDVLLNERSDLAVPILEKKIEDVLNAKSPADLFLDKSVDLRIFVIDAAVSIAGAADEQAMIALDKLIKIDEDRFGGFVRQTLAAKYGRGDTVKVAYFGLDLGNPAMSRRIVEWIEPKLFDKKSPTGVALFKQWWANAILDRYTVVPSEPQWARDPIASRLKTAEPDALRAEMARLCIDTLERRAKFGK